MDYPESNQISLRQQTEAKAMKRTSEIHTQFISLNKCPKCQRLKAGICKKCHPSKTEPEQPQPINTSTRAKKKIRIENDDEPISSQLTLSPELETMDPCQLCGKNDAPNIILKGCNHKCCYKCLYLKCSMCPVESCRKPLDVDHIEDFTTQFLMRGFCLKCSQFSKENVEGFQNAHICNSCKLVHCKICTCSWRIIQETDLDMIISSHPCFIDGDPTNSVDNHYQQANLYVIPSNTGLLLQRGRGPLKYLVGVQNQALRQDNINDGLSQTDDRSTPPHQYFNDDRQNLVPRDDYYEDGFNQRADHSLEQGPQRGVQQNFNQLQTPSRQEDQVGQPRHQSSQSRNQVALNKDLTEIKITQTRKFCFCCQSSCKCQEMACAICLMFVRSEFRIRDELNCSHFVCMSCSFKGATECLFCTKSTRVRVYKQKELKVYLRLIPQDYDAYQNDVHGKSHSKQNLNQRNGLTYQNHDAYGHHAHGLHNHGYEQSDAQGYYDDVYQ